MEERDLQQQMVSYEKCKEDWQQLCTVIDHLLQIKTIQGWDKLGRLLKEQNFQSYSAFFSEWSMLQQAFEIYEKEKVMGEKMNIFADVNTILELQSKMNLLKFWLLRVENEICVDGEFADKITETYFSKIAIRKMAHDICLEPEKIINMLQI